MNILDRILATKREEVAAARTGVPEAELRARIRDLPPPRDFVAAIRAKQASGDFAVIAEVKRKSPSAGVFRPAGDFDPARFAKCYEDNGAACLSVLTDRDYFGGCPEDLVAARAACRLPVLRKDFVVDAYQLVEARAMGADAVLFILGTQPVAVFAEWEALAGDLGLAVLAESHSADELDAALTLRTPLIGINNRDLTRFTTQLDTAARLAQRIGRDRIAIAESGLESRQDIDFMAKNGITTFLIGGALMRADDPGAQLRALLTA